MFTDAEQSIYELMKISSHLFMVLGLYFVVRFFQHKLMTDIIRVIMLMGQGILFPVLMESVKSGDLSVNFLNFFYFSMIIIMILLFKIDQRPR